MFLSEYIGTIDKKINGLFIEDIIQINKQCLCLVLDRQKEKCLFFSLSKQKPAFFMFSIDYHLASLDSTFLKRLKAKIFKAKLVSINKKEDDNVIMLELLENSPYILAKKYFLIFEQFPLKPNLILLDENLTKIMSFYAYKNTSGKIKGGAKEEIVVSDSFAYKQFYEEIHNRKFEKYALLIKHLKNKIKANERKIEAINLDHDNALNNIKKAEIIENNYPCDINRKEKVNSINIDGNILPLDNKLSIQENIDRIFSKRRKGLNEIKLYEQKIRTAIDEKKAMEDDLSRIEECSEREIDIIAKKYGLNKKEKETVQTKQNTPYKININGTIILFGKNIEQNDFLSFVYKTDREFFWFHVKDYSSGHVLLKTKNPTAKEIQIAASIALLTKKMLQGEVVYTKKKNIRRTKNKGEALLKNYSVVKIHHVEKEVVELYKNAKLMSGD